MTDSTIENKGRSLPGSIALSGLLVGTLDITAAVINYMLSTGKSPIIVCQFICSAILGKSAYSGGFEMVILGLLMHFCIAFSFTVVYFLLYPHIKLMQQRPVLAGLLYGVFIWVVMTLILVPLTSAPRLPFKVQSAVIGMLILMFAIGLPLGLAAHKHYNKSNTKP